MYKSRKVLIIGGGAAGMAAAVFAAKSGCEVHLFEKNEKCGRKLFITGKGRCNFTNACEEDDFLSHIVTNPKFLYSSFSGFTNRDAVRLFENLGVRTKTERGDRVFPASDHSSDIIRALEREMERHDVRLHLRTEVASVLLDEIPDERKAGGKSPAKRAAGVILKNGTRVYGDAVIVATGGLSYSSTGSDGDGYRFAEEAGMRVTECRPSLVPLLVEEDYIAQMQGLSLKNVTLAIRYGGKKKKTWSGFGEMLFTHKGVSGPLVLSASSVIGKELQNGPLQAWIDLKPALTEEQLDARLLREFDGAKNREFKNIIPGLLPAKMRPVMIRLGGIDPEKPANSITKEERTYFVRRMKHFPFTITGTGDYNEAIITQGGVSVREINPRTMEARKVSGLYFIGEVLDVDGVTGGFNLQIAWSTAHAAALAVSGAGENADQ